MKLTKTTISKTKYFLLALLVAFSFSCSPEDGEDGAIGPAGPAGTSGTDGNANVQTLIFNNPSWSSGSPSMRLDTSSTLTDDIINNDAILTYIKPVNHRVAPIPGLVFASSGYKQYNVIIAGQDGQSGGLEDYNIGIISKELDGSFTPIVNLVEMSWVKIIIIESSSVTTNKNVNGKQQIYNELSQAGVDISDYYAVCDYYGIAY